MDVKVDGNQIYVSLSVRNAKQLLEANEKGFGMGIVRKCEGDVCLHVVVENDEDHYGKRVAGPGLEAVLTLEALEVKQCES